jgi:hypothetical protein
MGVVIQAAYHNCFGCTRLTQGVEHWTAFEFTVKLDQAGNLSFT